MLRLGIVWLAVVVYVVVLGCVISSESGAKDRGKRSPDRTPIGSNVPLEGLPYCSVTMQLQRTDWIDKYEKNIDEIAAIGADTVQFVVDPRMENGKTSKVWLDMRLTPNPDQLGRLIKHAKNKKLRVILMPIVLLDNPEGSEWRGTIHPSWDTWFDSYREVMKFYAWVAEANHVDLLVVGSELVSTQDKLEEWTRTIQ